MLPNNETVATPIVIHLLPDPDNKMVMYVLGSFFFVFFVFFFGRGGLPTSSRHPPPTKVERTERPRSHRERNDTVFLVDIFRFSLCFFLLMIPIVCFMF